MMEESPLPDVRSNLIVAAGDLAIRLWDLLVPWTSPLCARLQDPCPGVKQTAGPVLTHVPLQDTVTGKGQGHAVYHLIPGIIRHLWDPDSGLQEESFHAMIRYFDVQPISSCPGTSALLSSKREMNTELRGESLSQIPHCQSFGRVEPVWAHFGEGLDDASGTKEPPRLLGTSHKAAGGGSLTARHDSSGKQEEEQVESRGFCST
ncbi:hypothetical protein DUI87_32858 [Hirundo rustica rustica]|uniref:Condensin complex subunit 1 C-terminal domain-containing protein n=1 Tax=Hirundo rustica rustica TaxID=333673 RepID=A0A3M0IP71_HIRRU|nr:hypothetical protein DUI87_32858 [Hirundo rustica rustica]